MKAEAFSRLLLLALERGRLTKLTASSPKEKQSEYLRKSGKLAQHKGETVLTLEMVGRGGSLRHAHYTKDALPALLFDMIGEFGQIRLVCGDKEATLLSSKKGTVTTKGVAPLESYLSGVGDVSVTRTIDEKKTRVLRGDEPFLIALGISDGSGRVHDKRQAKFRQICHFLDHVSGVYPELPAEGPLTVYDLCCGKSYLSFALYHYLTAIKHRDVLMLGIDLKKDVMTECAQIAKSLGFDGMVFRCDDVRNAKKEKTPDLLISLHACDLATDIVLDTGISLGARVILSTPCCHRALAASIKADALAFVTRHGQLRNKLCDALTDALRVLRLQSAGYSVTALELTDPDNTPKNTLLRAILKPSASKNSPLAKKAATEYEAALTLLLGDASRAHLIDGSDI